MERPPDRLAPKHLVLVHTPSDFRPAAHDVHNPEGNLEPAGPTVEEVQLDIHEPPRRRIEGLQRIAGKAPSLISPVGDGG